MAAGNCRVELAGLLARQGKLDEAIGHTRRAIELIPDHATAYTQLAELMIRQEKLAEAAEAYRQSLRIRPADQQVHRTLVALYGRLGDDEAARYHRGLLERRDPGGQK